MTAFSLETPATGCGEVNANFASTKTNAGDFAYSPSGLIAKYRCVSGRKRTQAIPAKIIKWIAI